MVFFHRFLCSLILPGLIEKIMFLRGERKSVIIERTIKLSHNTEKFSNKDPYWSYTLLPRTFKSKLREPDPGTSPWQSGPANGEPIMTHETSIMTDSTFHQYWQWLQFGGQNEQQEAHNYQVVLRNRLCFSRQAWCKSATLGKREEEGTGEENGEMWSWAKGTEGFNEQLFLSAFI